jgi:hypothetical protein
MQLYGISIQNGAQYSKAKNHLTGKGTAKIADRRGKSDDVYSSQRR